MAKKNEWSIRAQNKVPERCDANAESQEKDKRRREREKRTIDLSTMWTGQDAEHSKILGGGWHTGVRNFFAGRTLFTFEIFGCVFFPFSTCWSYDRSDFPLNVLSGTIDKKMCARKTNTTNEADLSQWHRRSYGMNSCSCLAMAYRSTSKDLRTFI